MKELSGKTTQKLPISDIDGKSLKTPEEQAKRFKEHFNTILNCPEPCKNMINVKKTMSFSLVCKPDVSLV